MDKLSLKDIEMIELQSQLGQAFKLITSLSSALASKETKKPHTVDNIPLEGDLSNIACNAFTYLEYKESFAAYSIDPSQGDQTIDQSLTQWNLILRDYHFLSLHLADQSITELKTLVINEF